MTTPHTSPAVARGLAARLRDAIQAADRIAGFVFNGESDREPPPSGMADGEELATAHDFLLRVFQGASDPVNNRILTAATGTPDGVGIDQLATDLGLTRMAVLERVNGLIQVGLVARDLPADAVKATGAGEGVVELIAELEIEIAEWLRHRKRA